MKPKFNKTILLLKSIKGVSKNRKVANANTDKRLPMNAYPPVYETDEQLRFNLTLAIIGTGIGLIISAAKNYPKSTFINLYALVFGGFITIFALLYIIGTATRLRYQNPGEAQLWYISESGRRNAYDSMVEMFWNFTWAGIEFSLPFYLITSNRNHWIGACWALLELVTVNVFVKLNMSAGMDNDRETGNLQYNHNLKLKTAKEKREPFDAPPITRS